MSKYKPVLVLGSNSFAGSNFIKKLIHLNYNVIGVSRRNEINDVFLGYKNSTKFKKKFSFKKIDINKNLNKLVNLIIQKKPSIIINFMAQGMVEQSWFSPEDWYNTNLVSQSRLINKIYKFKFIKKYINFSTPEVYGNIKNWQKEKFDFTPTTPYAISRAAFDLHLKEMNKVFKFPIILTRAANIYGPNQQLYRIVPKTIISAMFKKELTLDGGGNSYRSFIFMDDVSDALIHIIKKGKIGESYHISSNKIYSIKQIVKFISKVIGMKLKIKVGRERLGKDKYYKLNSNKIRTLGWEDKTNLKKGIILTKDWIYENRNKFVNYGLYYKHIK